MDAGTEIRHQEKLGHQAVFADVEGDDEPRNFDVRAFERLVDGEIHHLLGGHAAFA